MLVKTILARYYDEHITYLLSNTPKVFQSQRKRVVQLIGNKHSSSLTDADVRDYMRRRISIRKGPDGKPLPVKPATIRQEWTLLLSAINHGIKHKWLTADDMPAVKLPPASEERDIYITREQGKTLIECAFKVSFRCGMFVVIGLFTGSRPTRIQFLMKSMVDLNHDIIDFRPTNVPVNSRKRYGRVRIMAELKPFLSMALKRGTGKWVLEHPGSVRSDLAKAVTMAGLSSSMITPNALRHICGTWAAEDGVDLWMIGRLLGNTAATVEKNYAHFHPSYQAGATQRNVFDEPLAYPVDLEDLA